MRTKIVRHVELTFNVEHGKGETIFFNLDGFPFGDI